MTVGGDWSVTDRRETARSTRRLVIFAGALGLAAIALCVQLVRLTVLVPSREGTDTLVMPQVERGAILDRQGRILAITTRQRRVSAWVPGLTDARQSATLLAGILNMDPAAIIDTWSRHDGYVVVKRKITEAEARQIAGLKAQGKLAGVRVEDDFGRFYPQGRLASHVVGYVGADNVPWDGIEYTFNDELAPQPVGTDTDTVFGSQVYLTIDADIEYQVEKIARAAFEAYKPDWMSILVMDSRSGEILAYSSLPDFDPNEFQNDSPQVDKSSLVNRPLDVSYEPGSTFKIFSLSSMLELGAITPQSHFFTPGYYVKRLANGDVIRIGDVGRNGNLTPREIIEFSSNSGAAYASDQVDSESLYRMLTRFGFGRPTGLPLLGETPGLLRKPSLWSARSKPTVTIGQEISVSAIQMIQAATAIANGGVLLKPQIVKKVVSPEGKVIREYGREPLWEVVSPQVAGEMLDFMEAATGPEGTARRVRIPGIRISAKTGTAQVAIPGGYSATDFIASLIGILPTDDPRLIIYVVLENPKGQNYYGSTVAGPIFHDVALAAVDILGIPREGTRVVNVPAEVSVTLPRQVEISSVMPDLLGTPKRLLLPLLLRKDISVSIRGSGYVVKQDPKPGAPVQAGMKITLELK
jgi:cell division protein FtsI (penicillin-binding protein 3)